MDLHRLRVVEFNTLVSEKEGKKKYTAELEEHKKKHKSSFDDKKYGTIQPENDSKCMEDKNRAQRIPQKIVGDGVNIKHLIDKIGPPGTSKQCLAEDQASRTPTSRISSFIKHKSKSEIFSIPSRCKPKKRELKKNSSFIDVLKLSQENTHPQNKKRTLNLFNRKSKEDQKKGDKHTKKVNNEEVHFLFARETPSFVRNCKKKTEEERKTSRKKQDTKLRNDVFGFQKNNRYIDPHLYHMSCNYLNLDKLPFKKITKGFNRKSKQPTQATPSSCKHHAMRVLNSSGKIETPAIYYNLNTHHARPHLRRLHHRHDSFDDHGIITKNRSRRMGKDKTVCVSPSSLSPLTRCQCDACIGSSKGNVPDILNNQDVLYACNSNPELCTPSSSVASTPTTHITSHATCKKKGIKTNKKVSTSNKRNRLFLGCFRRFKVTLTKLPSGKNCMKYFFFGLLIVVWSPCLLAVILAWVIMCPIKVTSLKGDASKRSFPMMNYFENRFRKKGVGCEFQQECVDDCLPQSKRSFMTSVAGWYSRAFGTFVNSFNALVSMLKLKNKPTCAGSSFVDYRNPNPKRKYASFYAESRGGMMKPTRRSNTRFGASTRVVQNMRCEILPTFWPKSNTCNRKWQPKIKSNHKPFLVPCSVHGAQYNPSYARYQSSPAGDAGPMIRKSASGCTCDKLYSRNRMYRNKMMQSSPVFMPMVPQRLQTHQRRYSSRRGQRRSAGGEMQHNTRSAKRQLPYPHLNVITMRYSGYKTPHKQSDKYCCTSPRGHTPPQNYDRLHTPPQNYDRLPCYAIPANKCSPRSCFDEIGTRPAYKRRPLQVVTDNVGTGTGHGVGTVAGHSTSAGPCPCSRFGPGSKVGAGAGTRTGIGVGYGGGPSTGAKCGAGPSTDAKCGAGPSVGRRHGSCPCPCSDASAGPGYSAGHRDGAGPGDSAGPGPGDGGGDGIGDGSGPGDGTGSGPIVSFAPGTQGVSGARQSSRARRGHHARAGSGKRVRPGYGNINNAGADVKADVKCDVDADVSASAGVGHTTTSTRKQLQGHKKRNTDKKEVPKKIKDKHLSPSSSHSHSTTRTPPKHQPSKNKVDQVKNRVAKAKYDAVRSYHCIIDAVRKSDKLAWPSQVSCDNLYVNILKRRPCFWIYRYCPAFYPIFLNLLKFGRNLRDIVTYCCAMILWCPLFLCLYVCCGLVCKLS